MQKKQGYADTQVTQKTTTNSPSTANDQEESAIMVCRLQTHHLTAELSMQISHFSFKVQNMILIEKHSN